MSLRDELKLPNPIQVPAHEAAMAVVLTGQMLQKEAGAVLRDFELTEAQFNVLMLLRYQSSEGGTSQTRLGEMLLVSRPNVTGLVDRLEGAGLVERIDDPDDRRVKLLRLTRVGARLVEKAETSYLNRLREIFATTASPELKALCRTLEKLRVELF